MEALLERLRRAEIEGLRGWFPPGSAVLEIGGGSGYQAAILGRWGCRVLSVDLADRPAGPAYAPVVAYDGAHLPARASSYDIVFSSNVLEHVHELQPLLGEMGRVLKPGGLMIHLAPTPAWRLWTSLAHYPHLLRWLWRRLTAGASADAPARAPQPQRTLGAFIARALSAGPHGAYPSALAELRHFSRRCWLGVFRRQGLEVLAARGAGLFYTGYGLAPGLPLAARRALARLAGSACHIFVLRRPPEGHCNT